MPNAKNIELEETTAVFVETPNHKMTMKSYDLSANRSFSEKREYYHKKYLTEEIKASQKPSSYVKIQNYPPKYNSKRKD